MVCLYENTIRMNFLSFSGAILDEKGICISKGIKKTHKKFLDFSHLLNINLKNLHNKKEGLF